MLVILRRIKCALLELYTMNNDKQISDSINIFTLSNGMRCVHRRTQDPVMYCGIVIDAGSRDEQDKPGLAHFVEHTLFKGTLKRNSWRIANRMETVGGELNAYTSKEETVLYSCAPAANTQRGLELLGDIVARSTFPANELENEKRVVIEEINSYLDSPCDSVYDEFEDLIYAGSALGHNILGTEQSVRALTSADCRAFIDTFYVPQRMVAYCASPDSPASAERWMERYFGGLHHPAPDYHRTAPPEPKRFDSIRNDNGYQAHTVMGSRIFGRRDPRRFSLFLLNNILGGPCMNSRLNREIRDKNGYAYSVDSSVALMSDCGLITVYFGAEQSHVKECKKIVVRELSRLADSTMNARSFETARRQYIGQLTVSSEQRESRVMNLAKSLLYFGSIHDMQWTADRIAELRAEDVRSMAEMILSSGLSSLTLC